LIVSGSNNSLTGTLNLFDNLDFNSDKQYHIRSVNSRLILSSTIGSMIAVSGGLFVEENIGIGISAPDHDIQIARTSQSASISIETTTSGDATLNFRNNGNQLYRIYADRARNALVISRPGIQDFMFFRPDNGFISVGPTVSAPIYPFEVNTDVVSSYAVKFFNDGNNANRHVIVAQGGADDGSGLTYYLSAFDGDATNVGNIQNNAGTFQLVDVSDERLKTNIAPTKIDGLKIVENISLIEHKFKKHKKNPKLHPISFSAQNVKEVFDYAVSTNTNGYMGVAKAAFVPVLVKSVQQLLKRVEMLESGSV